MLPGNPVQPGQPIEKPENPASIETDQPAGNADQLDEEANEHQADLNDSFTEDQFNLTLTPVADDALVAAIQELLEAGSKQVLNDHTETEVQASNGHPLERDSDSHKSITTAVIQGSSSSGPGSSSGSSGAPSTGSSQADTFAGHVNTIKYIERETSILAGSRVKKLKTKWIKPPPTGPPRNTFFLS